MDGVNSSTNSASDILKEYRNQNQGGKSEGGNKASDMGRNEFLDLMMAQMQNQNPLDPQKNEDFVAQLAQFSSLEEMQSLNSSVEDAMGQFRSTQALQASAMVGQQVQVEGNIANLGPEGEVKGAVEVPSATSNLRVNVYNPSGELVRQMDMGQQGSGTVDFSWDGENGDGDLMEPGDYRVQAEAQYDGETQELATRLNANVDSVNLENGGVTLNLAGRGSVPLDQVKQIN
ncbi:MULTISPECIES: flagellar hook assembly protein FlgD [Halomonadaceae]|uniref:Basal-body rod modification protein FlgD n=1 Tax=Vreelandella halophila TaxID=86177 RepID=A0A9X4YCV7_9GAMM|nr:MULTISPECIES: flagellar hook assembly protein FlgD [Halomonas]MYL27384.1 flagellar biosynthesis protein FlgD [Halomonas utahensis]MYL74510.1 flagellar biosynthesis protein FlgD [Halomonas sp. 22501_18_FS]